MSVFNIPRSLYKQMTDAMASYWWGKRKRTNFIGWHGRKYASLKKLVGWDSETYTLLTMQCWQSNVNASLPGQILLVLICVIGMVVHICVCMLTYLAA
jgi:hypothetical protein